MQLPGGCGHSGGVCREQGEDRELPGGKAGVEGLEIQESGGHHRHPRTPSHHFLFRRCGYCGLGGGAPLRGGLGEFGG